MEGAMSAMASKRSWFGAGLALALLISSLAAPRSAFAAEPEDYSRDASWLCRPGRADVCSEPVVSTVIPPDGSAISKRTYAPDPSAPIDCFYVYPTVSEEETANADMTAGPGEKRAAGSQFARFATRCRPYAPLYRQTTLGAMRGAVQGGDAELAYADVRAAWRWYLEHDNHGRGVVLIGHSQGSFHLTRLIAEEIDGKPAQRLLVSALLLGGRAQVPVGKDVGGTFKHVRLCTKADQFGCFVAYSTYLAAQPPNGFAIFGRAEGPGLADACSGPAALLGRADTDPMLPTRGEVARLLGTPFVENPGLVSAACRTEGYETFLAITVKPTGVGATALNRALTDLDARNPGWGLHAVDVNLTLGDLVELVGRQAKAWAAANAK
jgi:hypothetical protein